MITDPEEIIEIIKNYKFVNCEIVRELHDVTTDKDKTNIYKPGNLKLEMTLTNK